jgi:translation elongation factor EF-4
METFHGAKETIIINPCFWPDANAIEAAMEPVVTGTIICPVEYFKQVNQLCLKRRGRFVSETELSGGRILLKYKLPLNEIIHDFFDLLKKNTSGYGSFEYDDIDYEESDLVKLMITLNDEPAEELTQIVHGSRAQTIGRQLVEKLLVQVPPKNFKIAIQAKVGGKILARETVKAMRKDVTAKCYGGDQTRKRKLLKQQSESKKKLRESSTVHLSKNVLINILKKD